MDALATLGITLSELRCSFDANSTVRKAFGRLVLTAHPDKGGDADRFIAIRAAFEQLSSKGVIESLLAGNALGAASNSSASTKPSTSYYTTDARILAATRPKSPYNMCTAPSAKAVCSKCSTSIAMGAVRVGSLIKETQKHGRWSHLCCTRVPAKIHDMYSWMLQDGDEPNVDPLIVKEMLLSDDAALEAISGFKELSGEHQNAVAEHFAQVSNWAVVGVAALKTASSSASVGDKRTVDGVGVAASKTPAKPVSAKAPAKPVPVKAPVKASPAKAPVKAAPAKSVSVNVPIKPVPVKPAPAKAAPVKAHTKAAPAKAPLKTAPTKAPTKAPLKVAPIKPPATTLAIAEKKVVCLPMPGEDNVNPGQLSGRVLVLTGTFAFTGTTVAKGDLNAGKGGVEAFVSLHGGNVTSAVSGRTSILLIGDQPGMKKVTQAKARGISSIRLETLIEGLRHNKLSESLESAEPIELAIEDYSVGFHGNGLAKRIKHSHGAGDKPDSAVKAIA
jgi:antirestriction protein